MPRWSVWKKEMEPDQTEKKIKHYKCDNNFFLLNCNIIL